MPKPSFYTLLLAVAIAQLFVASAPAASALQGNVPAPPQLARRAVHADLNQRMLKKRRPQDTDPIVPINVVGDPQPTNTATSAAQGDSQPPANSRTTSTAAQASSSPGGILGDLSQLLNGGSSTSTTSSAATSSTTTATSSSTATSAPATTTTASHTTIRGSTTTAVVVVSGPAQTTPAAQDPNASFLPHSVVIGLIVAGSCIAAAAAIWTIIRKWKFSPSRHFEDRLEPINWEPTHGSGVAHHDPTVAALGRSGSRSGTNRPGSFASDSDHDGRNMSSVHHEPISMAPDFPPAHDFTAGPAGSGYVDMHRGPSPAPGQYGGAYGGHYETSNPYDAYDYNNTGYGQQQRRY